MSYAEVRLVQLIRPFVTTAEVGTETVCRWLLAADTLPASQPVERPQRPLTAVNMELMELDVQGSAPIPPLLMPADERPAYTTAQSRRTWERHDERETAHRSGSHGRRPEPSQDRDRRRC